VHKTIECDQALIEKYNYGGPIYTSYPTALEFNDEFAEADFVGAVANSTNKSLSLYSYSFLPHALLLLWL
jgi:oxygen-independent coproporphyrinogen-3 oxidase